MTINRKRFRYATLLPFAHLSRVFCLQNHLKVEKSDLKERRQHLEIAIPLSLEEITLKKMENLKKILTSLKLLLIQLS